MKNALLLAFLIMLGSALNAQGILLEETFNDGSLGVFTAYSVAGNEQEWTAREFGGRQFVQMNGFDDGIQSNEDWLISPSLDMDAQEGETLTFENACNFDGPNLEVLVSNDYDGTSDPNTANWTDLSDQVNFSLGSYEYVNSGALDLSAVSGTAHIAFKYISHITVEGKLWQLDSIVVSADIANNVAETETALISAPVVRDGQLQFDVNGAAQTTTFVLHNASGQLVRIFIAANNNSASIPVHQLPAGIYVLTARSAVAAQSVKIFIP